MDIALFDLDHTLIPFDSGAAFAHFLTARGALPPGFEAEYTGYCLRYAAGTVDMVEMHRFTVGALAVHDAAELRHWLLGFQEDIAPRIPRAAKQLVQDHQAAGHACALVTATTRFVAEPFGALLGLPVVLATQPELGPDDRYTGEIVGQPCFREHKVTHVQAWLARQGRGWSDVGRSWFYSDSIHDLPLLEAVNHPVAVNPDDQLLAQALARGWRVCRLSGD